jgi:hypothetical protein
VGLLDTLLGRSKPVRPNLDALFALPSAAVTLQSAAGLVSSSSAGVCWKPPAGQAAADVQRDISELLLVPDEGEDAPAPGPAGPMAQREDSFGYRWLLLDDPSSRTWSPGSTWSTAR